MYYDAGSTEKICEEQNRARSLLKGVRSNVAIIILGLIVIIGFTSMNIYLLTRNHSSVKSEEITTEIERHTEPGNRVKNLKKSKISLIFVLVFRNNIKSCKQE